LHPMVVLGVVVGLICYVGDPFLRRSHEPAVTLEALALSVVAGLLLLPSPSLPGRFTATHSLNDPHWTLLQEYLANIAYALILRRLSTRKLASVVAFSAGVLGVTALRMDGLLIGNKFETIWGAPIRMVFPFLCGMLLYRLRRRVALPQVGFVWLSLVLMLAFAVPVLTKRGGLSLNGAYDLACVTLLFPGIILAGAHSSPGRFVTTFCRSAGRLAYPLYAVHFPLLWVYIGFVIYNPPRPRLTSIVGWILAPTLLLIGWLAVIWWDEPVRRWLKRKYA